MANVRIEGGCSSLGAGWWAYQTEDNTGIHQYTFAALNGAIPKVGDSIDTASSTLVQRPIVPNPARDELQDGWPKPIINNDPGFQKKKFGREHPNAWPIQGKDS